MCLAFIFARVAMLWAMSPKTHKAKLEKTAKGVRLIFGATVTFFLSIAVLIAPLLIKQDIDPILPTRLGAGTTHTINSNRTSRCHEGKR